MTDKEDNLHTFFCWISDENINVCIISKSLNLKQLYENYCLLKWGLVGLLIAITGLSVVKKKKKEPNMVTYSVCL